MKLQLVWVVALSPICWYLNSFVASWIVHLPPDQAVWVQTFAGDIVLCSWEIYLVYSLSASLYPAVYEIESGKLNATGIPVMDYHSIQHCETQRYNVHVTLQALAWWASWLIHVCSTLLYPRQDNGRIKSPALQHNKVKLVSTSTMSVSNNQTLSTKEVRMNDDCTW